MMLALEAEKWVEDRLTADTELAKIVKGVYRYMAPPAAAMPCVVLALSSGRDVNAIGNSRLLTRYEFVIRAIGSLDMLSDLEDAEALIDAALVSGIGQVVGCARIASLAYVSLEASQYYRHVGGRYELISG